MGVDPTNPDIVFVGGIDFWRSDDGGANFGLISTWWTTRPRYLHAGTCFPTPKYHPIDQHTIVFSPNFANDTTIFFGNDGGVSITTNPYADVSTNPCLGFPGVTYTPMNEGYGTLQVNNYVLRTHYW